MPVVVSRRRLIINIIILETSILQGNSPINLNLFIYSNSDFFGILKYT